MTFIEMDWQESVLPWFHVSFFDNRNEKKEIEKRPSSSEVEAAELHLSLATTEMQEVFCL